MGPNHKSTLDNSNDLRAIPTTTSVPREHSAATNVVILRPPLTSQRRRTAAATTRTVKEIPKSSRPSPPNILTTTTMMMKIISASSKITHAVRTTIRSTFVTIRHEMDTKHSVYPKPILMPCDFIPRIIAVLVLVSETLTLRK